MVESVRVSKNGIIRECSRKRKIPCEYRNTVHMSTENGRIRASIEKLMGRVPEKGAISVRTEKMVEFRRVPRKARIRPSIGKHFGRVPEKVEFVRLSKS